MCGYTALSWMHCGASRWCAAAVQNVEKRFQINQESNTTDGNVEWDRLNEHLRTNDNVIGNAAQQNTILIDVVRQ